MKTELLSDPGINSIAPAQPAGAAAPQNYRDAALCGVHPNDDANASDKNINEAFAAYQDSLEDWTCAAGDLAESARSVRDWSTDLWDRFVAAEFQGPPVELPPIFFRFCRERPTVLGHYHPGRNDAGLRWEISINPRHLQTQSEAQVAATVLHELMHCREELTKTLPRSRNNYHTAWFRGQAKAIGIPCSTYGHDSGIADPSPFAAWAHERGLSFDGVMLVEGPQVRAAASSVPKRVVWLCDCPPERRVEVMIARGSKLRARCELCGAVFIART